MSNGHQLETTALAYPTQAACERAAEQANRDDAAILARIGSATAEPITSVCGYRVMVVKP
jgi:hypothetical protein